MNAQLLASHRHRAMAGKIDAHRIHIMSRRRFEAANRRHVDQCAPAKRVASVAEVSALRGRGDGWRRRQHRNSNIELLKRRAR